MAPRTTLFLFALAASMLVSSSNAADWGATEEEVHDGGRDLFTSNWPVPAVVTKGDCSFHAKLDSVSCQMLNTKCMAKFGVGLKWVGDGCSRSERAKFCPKAPPLSANACLNNGDGGCQCAFDATGAEYQYCGFKCKSQCQRRAMCRWVEGALGGCRTWDGSEYVRPRICPAKAAPIPGR